LFKHLKSKALLTASIGAMLLSTAPHAEILAEATVVVKIPLAKSPTTRPITVAYVPLYDTYYVADGGLAPMGSDFEAPVSKSEIHAFSSSGQYINSAKPGYDNRSIYFNPNSSKLETITYNISSDAGFAPNTGMFALDLGEKGEIKETSSEIMQFNKAFGSAATIPSYDADGKRFFAKQERSNSVFIVDPKKYEKVAEIKLELDKAGAAIDDISNHFIAFSSVKGEELVLLDVDHKTALIFDINGKFVGKSQLPQHLKLRANNHFNGVGYANNLLFVYNESEGDFGTYYGLQVVK
jgi:hypothetical protein